MEFADLSIQALRDLGRDKEADAMYDWKDWNGGPHGYEGLLVDGYTTLLAAMPGGRT